MLRSFIEQEKLPVRVTRSATNDELLDMIEDAVADTAAAQDDPEAAPAAAGMQEEVSAPRRR